MKTLSDDITLALDTAGMNEGYVITSIYHNGIGVFTGHSWIPGDDSSLYVNINDIVEQNRGRIDYLKLADNGELKTMPMREISFGAYTRYSRFYNGQIGLYSVTIQQDNVIKNKYEKVLSGYDYPNKDLKPLFLLTGEEDSSLCRVMQGCDWIYNHDDEIGRFKNLLLPHYPAKLTDKYGIGIHLWSPVAKEYSLQGELSGDVSIGYAFNYSDMTFITLDDLLATSYTRGKVQLNSDKDTPVYLREYQTSGDEFGDWEEGWDGYYGTLSLDSITVYGDTAHSTITIGTFTSGAEFNSYLQRYMHAHDTSSWNYNAIVNGNRVVYTTVMKRWEAQVTSELNTEAARFPLVGVDPEPSESEYLNIVLQPNFSQNVYSATVPDRFIGTCPVAILDHCYSRYYLAWYDRYGEVMSQAFDGKFEYEEEIETEEIKDYKLRRRISHNNMQPKWKLNTTWLNEEIYPMYEAIFTSPYVLLYDTETDRAWNVIVTDKNYKEKRFNTEKKLFNLELNVEANKKQELTY